MSRCSLTLLFWLQRLWLKWATGSSGAQFDHAFEEVQSCSIYCTADHAAREATSELQQEANEWRAEKLECWATDRQQHPGLAAEVWWWMPGPEITRTWMITWTVSRVLATCSDPSRVTSITTAVRGDGWVSDEESGIISTASAGEGMKVNVRISEAMADAEAGKSSVCCVPQVLLQTISSKYKQPFLGSLSACTFDPPGITWLVSRLYDSSVSHTVRQMDGWMWK